MIYRFLFMLLGLGSSLVSVAQVELSGRFIGDDGPIIYSNVALYSSPDSSLYKVETTNEEGQFRFYEVASGSYFFVSSYIGLEDYRMDDITVGDDNIEFGELEMVASGVQLETAIVTAKRAMVEVKPDRTVFNVQGTINSVGDNGLNLLRKAPGVTIDNNNNVSLLSRSGVLFYIDGKRMPLTGDDLAAYLENLPAEQIDRIDIISNPGAKYEAQGNAGIIDIKLKKDKSLGANGSASATYSKGKFHKSNTSVNGNYRNKRLNVYGTLGYSDGIGYEASTFDGYQNGFRLFSQATFKGDRIGKTARIGTDYFVGKNQTFGVLVNYNKRTEDGRINNTNIISSNTNVDNYDTTPADIIIPYADIDSIVKANNSNYITRKSITYNLNYRYDNGTTSINADADYGAYNNTSTDIQPNDYFDKDDNLLRSNDFYFDTPTDIFISTLKLDYETEVLGGRLGLGTKYSKVKTNNTFLFYDGAISDTILNRNKSNLFDYNENVLAGYLSYNRTLNEKWNLSSGLRVESTNTEGILTTFNPDLYEPPLKRDYINVFPTLGLTYAVSQGNTLSFNYGRRINRPDYNVLNPFRRQISELSFANGNPSLKAEIVNNFEVGYTLKYRYNIKAGYSYTQDKITRLIGIDQSDPKASFINWDNLAEVQVYSLNLSLPFQVTEKWSAFVNLGGSHKQNKATYPNGVIDLGVWNYNLFAQNTFTLPHGISAELSGYYAGPGIWGGVFTYEESWALNLGVQKRFLQDKLNLRLSVNDIFDQAYWSGYSDFSGLLSYGQGDWDNQRVSLSLSYNFGNKEVKSRKRETGLEDEGKRVK